jgi:hypothetical protein
MTIDVILDNARFLAMVDEQVCKTILHSGQNELIATKTTNYKSEIIKILFSDSVN